MYRRESYLAREAEKKRRSLYAGLRLPMGKARCVCARVCKGLCICQSRLAPSPLIPLHSLSLPVALGL